MIEMIEVDGLDIHKFRVKYTSRDTICPFCGFNRSYLSRKLKKKGKEVRELFIRVCQDCEACREGLAITYRELTNKCEVCGSRMTSHPKCETCGILCGPGHLSSITKYHSHDICGYCLRGWKNLESHVGREVLWDELPMVGFVQTFNPTARLRKIKEGAKLL